MARHNDSFQRRPLLCCCSVISEFDAALDNATRLHGDGGPGPVCQELLSINVRFLIGFWQA